MAETPPRIVSRNEADASLVSESANGGSEKASENSNFQSEGPQTGTTVAEEILAADREGIRITNENLQEHARTWERSAPEQALEIPMTVAAKPDSELVRGVKGTGKGIVGASKWAGGNFLALLGLFGSWIWMALKGAGSMAGKGGGGGHGGDHGGGHH